MTWLILFTALFLPMVRIPGPGGAAGTPPPSVTVTELCAVNAASCSIAPTTNHGIVVFVTSENAAPSYSFTDPCTDTYTQATGSPQYNSAVGTTVNMYTAKATCSTSGTLTSSGATVSILAAYDVTTYTAVDSPAVNAGGTVNLSSSWSFGPSTNSATANDVCLAGIMGGSSNTISAGTGFTLLAGSNQVVDGRNSGFEYYTILSGSKATFTASFSGSTSGSLVGQCSKL